ncbi:MAG: hypothetical protein KatS3mg097_016 [Candidatus Parcubacteria bacterium]|nr:MAG: hypothetical protein KatS3mg097_016 [Candidatus Parcubacteria bacterium]
MISNFLILLGVVLIIFGLILKFNFKLPGDILIQKENFTFYFPIVTSIVVSILLTIIISLIKKIK